MKKFFSYLLLFISVFLLAFGAYLVVLRNSPRTLAFESAPQHAPKKYEAATPKTLIIPSINVTLPIIPAKIIKNTWETTNDGVSYWSASPIPGSRGNSVLYGHNWKSLLGSLPNIKPGNTIQVIMSDGKTVDFIVEYTAVVSPTQTDIIRPTKDTRITIYTCTGFLDSKRFVVVAMLNK